MIKFLLISFLLSSSVFAFDEIPAESNADLFQGVYSQNIKVKYFGTELVKAANGLPVPCFSDRQEDCVDLPVNEISIQKLDDVQNTYYVKMRGTGAPNRSCQMKIEMRSNKKTDLLFRSPDHQCSLVLTRLQGHKIQVRDSGCDKKYCDFGASLSGTYSSDGRQLLFEKLSTSISILRSEEI